MRNFKFGILLLLVLGTAQPGFPADAIELTPNNGKSAKTSAPAAIAARDWKCRSTTEINGSAIAIHKQIQTWVQKQPPARLSSNDLGDAHEGRLVQLYGAEFLPPSAPMRRMYRICWLHFVNFTTALSEKKIKAATDFFDDWKNCVDISFQPLPAEAAELESCWLTAHRASVQ